MAATLGKDGSFRVGSTLVTFVDSWSLNTNIASEEVTAYGDTHRAYVQTFRDWSASVSGTLDKSDAQQAALLDQFEDGSFAEIDCRLYTGSATYWSGSAIITAATVNSEVSGKVSVSFELQGSNALSYT